MLRLLPNPCVYYLPRGRGRKGGRAKHQRTRNCNPPLIDNVIVRPGMQTSVNSDVRFGTLVNVSHDNVTVGSGSVSNNIHVFLDSDVPSPSFSLGPPPLIGIPLSNASFFQQVVTHPFYLKVLAGNIHICQGCRGSLRLNNGAVPSPPLDLVIARMERQSYRDSSGVLRTPTRPSAAHYHLKLMLCYGSRA